MAKRDIIIKDIDSGKIMLTLNQESITSTKIKKDVEIIYVKRSAHLEKMRDQKNCQKVWMKAGIDPRPKRSR